MNHINIVLLQFQLPSPLLNLFVYDGRIDFRLECPEVCEISQKIVSRL